MRELSEQERFWQGEFGTEYLSRNQGEDLVAGNISLFSTILQHCQGVDSVLELGTNRGLNLRALNTLLPNADLYGVELNTQACQLANELGIATVWNGSLFDYEIEQKVALSFTKGVLIHLFPSLLPQAYAKLYDSSLRYILIAEYYNPTPVEVVYRGNQDKLFKRDFAGEMLEAYPDLSLRAYGCTYRRDANFLFDDINWFLLEKNG